MADDFLEQDLDTPTEHDLEQAYGSQYLSVADVGSRKIRTKILNVRKQMMPGREGKPPRMRFILFFESQDKPMVLNATNKDMLIDSLGKTPANWKGATVGLYVDPNVGFGGKRTGGVRLKVILPPPKPAAAATPEPEPKPKPAAAAAPEPKPTAATPPGMEDGDPGFDPELNDPVPDFTPGRITTTNTPPRSGWPRWRYFS